MFQNESFCSYKLQRNLSGTWKLRADNLLWALSFSVSDWYWRWQNSIDWARINDARAWHAREKFSRWRTGSELSSISSCPPFDHSKRSAAPTVLCFRYLGRCPNTRRHTERRYLQEHWKRNNSRVGKDTADAQGSSRLFRHRHQSFAGDHQLWSVQVCPLGGKPPPHQTQEVWGISGAELFDLRYANGRHLP